MDDVFVYLTNELPDDQAEFTTPCNDGYTVYINAKMNYERQLEAYNHALEHIKNGDFDVDRVADVQEIEAKAHGLEPVKADKFKSEVLERIRKERRSVKAKLARRTARNKRLEEMGVDMFLVAEAQWLDPDRR